MNCFYNSIYIGGTENGSNKNTYAYHKPYDVQSIVKNNLFVNKRTGGTGCNHFAISVESIPFVVFNNFYSGTGSTPANFMQSSVIQNFDAWKAAVKDSSSFASVASAINFTNLFNDITAGDLTIKNTNEECWIVNRKGVANSGIADDFGATGVRSTTAGDATDIGADEFTPASGVNPPSADASGAPAANATTTYTVFGKPVASIVWGANGTFPTAITVKYFSGEKAPGTTSFTTSKMYWDISAQDGSGYTYDITLTYDENQLGGITENNLHPAKSTDGGNTWIGYTSIGNGAGQFQRNTSKNTITIYGLSDFSIFTLGTLQNPLPVELVSFTAIVKDRNITLNWQTRTETNSNKYVIVRKLVSNDTKLK